MLTGLEQNLFTGEMYKLLYRWIASFTAKTLANKKTAASRGFEKLSNTLSLSPLRAHLYT